MVSKRSRLSGVTVHNEGASQSSSRNPATRLNSRVLCVTSIKLLASAITVIWSAADKRYNKQTLTPYRLYCQ